MHHVTMKNYEGGHMMYIYRPSLIKLKEDLAAFYIETLIGSGKEEEEAEIGADDKKA